MFRLAALLLLSFFSLSAQDRVSPEFLNHRVWAVVPLIGTGTKEDPRRPMFVPSPAERRAASAARAKDGKDKTKPPAFLGYSMQVSDDGRSALVEFVLSDQQAAKEIMESRAPGVKAFERGNARKEEVEDEFKKHKRNFKMESFGGRAQ